MASEKVSSMNLYFSSANSPALTEQMSSSRIAYLGSLTTLIAGLIAVYLYLKQRADKRRGIASLIYQEILSADSLSRKADNGWGYLPHDRLVQSDTWENNKHLFTTLLNNLEFTQINNFYAIARDIDGLQEALSEQRNLAHIATASATATGSALTKLKPDGTSIATHDRVLELRNLLLRDSLIGTVTLTKFEMIASSRFSKLLLLFRLGR